MFAFLLFDRLVDSRCSQFGRIPLTNLAWVYESQSNMIWSINIGAVTLILP